MNTRAVAVVPPLRCAAFRHVGARRVSPGPPLRPAGCRARLNRRQTTAVAALGAVAAGRRSRSRWSPCGSGRVRSLRPGPQGRALARDRAARLRLLSRAVTDQTRPAKTPARTPSLCSSLAASALRRRPFRREMAALPGTPAPSPTTRPLTRPSRHSAAPRHLARPSPARFKVSGLDTKVFFQDTFCPALQLSSCSVPAMLQLRPASREINLSKAPIFIKRQYL